MNKFVPIYRSGITPIDTGEILYKEEVISKLPSKEKKEIRYVPKSAVLLEYITGKSYLNGILNAYKMQSREQIEEWESYFSLDTNKLLMDMTYKENKLTAIIGAIITKPELLILDNPFEHLSEKEVLKLLDLLKQLNKEGTTIILATTHYEDVCDYGDSFLYLKHGKVIASGTDKKESKRVKLVTITNPNNVSGCDTTEHTITLEKKFGKPILETANSYSYMTNLEWAEIGTILKECQISDRNVAIHVASKEEELDILYKSKETEE